MVLNVFEAQNVLTLTEMMQIAVVRDPHARRLNTAEVLCGLTGK